MVSFSWFPFISPVVGVVTYCSVVDVTVAFVGGVVGIYYVYGAAASTSGCSVSTSSGFF